MRNAVMTHCVGVLVVSELRQRGAVLRLPGFGGPLSVLDSLWACVATADRVLPRAARIARRDVLLISVCFGGGGSVPRQKMVRKWDAFSLSAAHFISVKPGQLLLETKSQGQPNTSFTYTFTGANELFSFPANSIYCLFTVHGLIRVFCCHRFKCTSLIHMSVISQTPPNLHQQGLAAYCYDSTCYDCTVSLWTRLLHRMKLYDCVIFFKTPLAVLLWTSEVGI